jgi:hypothetical protein
MSNGILAVNVTTAMQSRVFARCGGNDSSSGRLSPAAHDTALDTTLDKHANCNSQKAEKLQVDLGSGAFSISVVCHVLMLE